MNRTAAETRSQVPDGCPLTGSEFVVVQLVAQGLSYKEVAARLGIAHGTVRIHLHNAYRRLNVLCAMHAVLACVKAGWIDVEIPGYDRAPDPRADDREGLRRALSDLAGAIRERQPPVTLRQHAYLEAFDELLRARNSDAAQAARARMLDRLGGVLAEAGVDRGRVRYERHEVA